MGESRDAHEYEDIREKSEDNSGVEERLRDVEQIKIHVMGKKLHGMINLNRIPNELKSKNSKGDEVIWVDIMKLREPDKYGNTHSVAIYDKANKKAVYIGNVAETTFGNENNDPF